MYELGWEESLLMAGHENGNKKKISKFETNFLCIITMRLKKENNS